jgi:mannose-6-phosphate isomerase
MYRKHQLPFLFKLLSVRTALSIQAHPDKQTAARLHALDPEHYRDDNHKPELACALTEFEVLCSFRPRDEMLALIRGCPELLELLGAECVAALAFAKDDPAKREALRGLYTKLMSSADADVRTHLRKLTARLEVGVANESEALALRLQRQYPFDVGVFCAFLLNHFTLAPVPPRHGRQPTACLSLAAAGCRWLSLAVTAALLLVMGRQPRVPAAVCRHLSRRHCCCCC